MAVDDPVPAAVAHFQQLITLPLGPTIEPRLSHAKAIVTALEGMTVAQQERYYAAIHQIKQAMAPPAPADVEELIEWG